MGHTPEAPVAPVVDSLQTGFQKLIGFFSNSFVFTLLLALGLPGLVLLILVLGIARHQPIADSPERQSPAHVVVAELTGLDESEGGDPDASNLELRVGAKLFSGRQVQLKAGLAELTFAKGAKVLLQGPVTFRIGATAGGYLDKGVLTATVPPAGRGFTVETPLATVVDLGTEFGVAVGENGVTEAHVFKGKVELAVKATLDSAAPRKRLLREKQAVRVRVADANRVPQVEQSGGEVNVRTNLRIGYEATAGTTSTYTFSNGVFVQTDNNKSVYIGGQGSNGQLYVSGGSSYENQTELRFDSSNTFCVGKAPTTAGGSGYCKMEGDTFGKLDRALQVGWAGSSLHGGVDGTLWLTDDAYARIYKKGSAKSYIGRGPDTTGLLKIDGNAEANFTLDNVLNVGSVGSSGHESEGTIDLSGNGLLIVSSQCNIGADDYSTGIVNVHGSAVFDAQSRVFLGLAADFNDQGIDITISGLDPGQSYLVALYAYDYNDWNGLVSADWTANGEKAFTASWYAEDDGGEEIDLPTSLDTFKHTVVVEADANGEILMVSSPGEGTNRDSYWANCSGLELYQIPEPGTTICLLSLISCVLFVRRR